MRFEPGKLPTMLLPHCCHVAAMSLPRSLFRLRFKINQFQGIPHENPFQRTGMRW